MNLINKKEQQSNVEEDEVHLNTGPVTKIFMFFGLVFAQISNFVFWIEDAIPMEGFFIFDMFLIFSLFFVILKEHGNIASDSIFSRYTFLLGTLNNFIATLFFLLWGLFFPYKDMAFVKKVGINANFQTGFDIISLIVLCYLFLKYKNDIAGLTTEKVIIAEFLLILGLASTLLLF